MLDMLTILATLVFVAFAFGYGACFGSFLNVVVWRMPQKMPLMWARSHCPKCKHDIHGTDNIPVFGWLRLKGKCRHCALPISARYPLIEGAMGLLVVWLFLLIVVAHGATLPTGWIRSHLGSWLTEFPRCPLLNLFVHQAVLGYFLAGIALIDEDRQQTPWKWTLIGTCLHLLIVFFTPEIGMIDYLSGTQTGINPREATLSMAATYSLCGLIVAMGGALIARFLKVPHHITNVFQALALIGVFLGPVVVAWAMVVAGISLSIQVLTTKKRTTNPGRTSGLATQLLLAWLIILNSWRWWPATDWQLLQGIIEPQKSEQVEETGLKNEISFASNG